MGFENNIKQETVEKPCPWTKGQEITLYYMDLDTHTNPHESDREIGEHPAKIVRTKRKKSGKWKIVVKSNWSNSMEMLWDPEYKPTRAYFRSFWIEA